MDDSPLPIRNLTTQFLDVNPTETAGVKVDQCEASLEVAEYRSCSGCCNSSSTEVIFHSHVTQFDQLVKLIAIIGEHLETHTNISVVISGDTKQITTELEYKDSKPSSNIKAEFVIPIVSNEYEDDNGNMESSEEDQCDEDYKEIPPKKVRKSSKQKTKEENGEAKEPRKVYCCDECGKTFKERSSLWRHRKVTHEKVEKYMNRSKQVKDYKCPVCSDVIHDTYQRYFLHKQKCEAEATGVNPYVCSICGRSFPTTNQHGNHFTSCSGKGKKYYNTKKCTYANCEYRTSNNIELDNHVRRTHLNVPITKNHICTLCGNAYNKVAILNQHIKSVHMNEKPHDCPTCGRSFARKQKMKDHMKIHTGESKYTCPLCNKNFNNGDSKWNHKKSCPGRKEEISKDTIVKFHQEDSIDAIGQPFSISII